MTRRVVVVALGGLGAGSVAQLAREDAARFADLGWDSVLVARPGPEEAVDRVSVRRLDGALGKGVTRVLRGRLPVLRRTAAAVEAAVVVPRLRPELVVAHGGFEAAVLGVLPRRRYRLAFRLHNFQQGTARGERSYRFLERWLYYGADRVGVARATVTVAVSEWLARTVMASTGRPVGAVRNGVQLPNAVAPWVSRDVDVLFVGRLAREKGVDRLPLIAAGLRPGERMIVAGDGPEGSAVAEGLRGHAGIELLGEVDHASALALMQRSRVLVVPSLHEPLGMVVMEGMGSGCCVVAHATGGIPELVRNGTEGVVIAAGSSIAAAVRAVLDDPSAAQRLAAGGVGAARAFAADSAARRLVAAYVDA